MMSRGELDQVPTPDSWHRAAAEILAREQRRDRKPYEDQTIESEHKLRRIATARRLIDSVDSGESDESNAGEG